MQRWQRTEDSDAQDYHIFRLRRHSAVSPRTGVAGRYVTIESPDWANVLALTEDGEVILVRQYRHGTDDISLEIPGGIVDPGEEPAAAAARELLEETGYQASAMRLLGSVDPNPALFNNRCYHFLATGCRLTAVQRLDHGEDVDVELMPLPEMGKRVAREEIRHAMVISACFWYVLAGQPGGPLLSQAGDSSEF